MKVHYLLCLRQLLDSAIHTLLKDHDFLVLLFAQTFPVAGRVVEFDQQIINLKLLSLSSHQRCLASKEE